MTQKEIQALHLGLTKEGTLCFCKTNRAGKSVLVRNISPEESANICAILFTLHQRVHPDQKVMYIPYGEGTALAITEVELSKE